jgi:hypothetical protein
MTVRKTRKWVSSPFKKKLTRGVAYTLIGLMMAHTMSKHRRQRPNSAASPTRPMFEIMPELNCTAATTPFPDVSQFCNMGEKERQKELKRLRILFHPDKNLNCKDLATERFQSLDLEKYCEK